MDPSRPPASDAHEGAWLESLQQERQGRDAHYRDADGPLSPESRAAFPGLRWFAPDPAWRLRGVPLARHAEPSPAGLDATGADAVRFVEVGTLSFPMEGRRLTLHAFEPAPGEADEAYILLPFRDATSGTETYGGGRYVDLEPTAGDVYELDFNRAYHPYCAHDDRWACVLPPPQNRLPVRVAAGERL